MAFGIDPTAGAVGLLSGYNQQANQQRQDVRQGDLEQFEKFQDAASEYDKAKAKASDDGNKIDSLANVISGGKPDAAAYATARDAVNLGYTSQDHLPYVIQAYKSTKQDMQDNPDKWNVPNTNEKQVGDQDTNPQQTAILRRFGDQDSQQRIESVRQNNITRPYNNLPGASWSNNPEQAVGQQAYTRSYQSAKGAAQATQDVGNAAIYQGGSGGRDLLNSGDQQGANTPPPDAQTAQAPQQQPSPNAQGLDVSSSALQPPPGGPQSNPSPGISLPGPPPPESTLAPATTVTDAATASATPASARNEDFMTKMKGEAPLIAPRVQEMSDGIRPMITPYMLARGKPGDQNDLTDKLLSKYDPNPDQNRYQFRQKFIDDNKGTLTSINTVVNHLGTLDKAATAMNNGDTRALNTIANKLGIQAGPNQSAINTYNLVNQRLSQELTGLYRKGLGTGEEVNETEKNMSNTLNPASAHDAITAQVSLLHGMLDAKDNDWKRGMTTAYKPFDFLSPQAKETLKSFDDQKANSSPPVATDQDHVNALAATGTPVITTKDGRVFRKIAK